MTDEPWDRYQPGQAERQGIADLNRLLDGMGDILARRMRAKLRRRRITASSALLAAAGVGALLVASRGAGPEVGDGAPSPLLSTIGLDVESPDRFAVFPTNNPDIAVVWVFPEEE